MIENAQLPDDLRFWSLVEKAPGEGCWLWSGGRDHSGYGKMSSSGKAWLAHRFSWTISYGDIPFGLCVLHRCDTPPCVRPDHLFVGTYTTNARDRAFKGRSAPKVGVLNGRAKLTWPHVERMRELHQAGWKQDQLAEQYGVRQCHVSRIVRNESWRVS